jgi:hypothetical protein
MRNGHNPDPFWLRKIDDPERKPPHLPASRPEFARLSHGRTAFNSLKGFLDQIEKIVSQELPPSLVEGR